LSLPTEGVADAVDEVVVALGVAAQEVATTKIGVAAAKGVTHQLGFRGLWIRVAVVRHRGTRRDLPEQLARLVDAAPYEETVGPAHQLARRHVVACQRNQVMLKGMRAPH